MNEDDLEQRVAELERQLRELNRADGVGQPPNVVRRDRAPIRDAEQRPWLSTAHAAALAENQARRGGMGRANLVGWIGLFIGGLAAVWGVGVAMAFSAFPSTAMWTSDIVCDRPYRLEYSTGSGVWYRCVSGDTWQQVNGSVFALQALLVALIVFVPALVAGACFLVWRRRRGR